MSWRDQLTRELIEQADSYIPIYEESWDICLECGSRFTGTICPCEEFITEDVRKAQRERFDAALRELKESVNE